MRSGRSAGVSTAPVVFSWFCYNVSPHLYLFPAPRTCYNFHVLSCLFSLIDLREDDESTDTINAMGVVVEHYALIKSAYQEDMELNADSSTI